MSVCDIDAEGLETLARETEDLTTLCDASKREDIERMVTSAIESLGGLDVLVNNAGIAGRTTPVDKMDPDDWDKVVQVNLNGTFNVTRLAIPHLKKSPAARYSANIKGWHHNNANYHPYRYIPRPNRSGSRAEPGTSARGQYARWYRRYT